MSSEEKPWYTEVSYLNRHFEFLRNKEFWERSLQLLSSFSELIFFFGYCQEPLPIWKLMGSGIRSGKAAKLGRLNTSSAAFIQVNARPQVTIRCPSWLASCIWPFMLLFLSKPLQITMDLLTKATTGKTALYQSSYSK